ncbi:MAG: hypothetical protein KA144_07210 [Xanthomonadaceae bacterium]|nr:hypothetical protein [Xanthomonadaceae bacterium]
MRIFFKLIFAVTIPTIINGCAMTSVATTNEKGHSVRLTAALCEDGSPAVSILGARPQQTGRNQKFNDPLPKTVFLRPGMYYISVKCERNRPSCGDVDERNWLTRGPRMLMTYFEANESKTLDCEARTGEPFVSGDTKR